MKQCLMMKIIRYLGFTCLAIGLTCNIYAGDQPYGFPKIIFTYDFNTLFYDNDSYGFRVQIQSNNRQFDNGVWKKRPTDSSFAYAYGIGFGSYTVQSMEKKGSDNDFYHVFSTFAFSYQNRSSFEPFVGVYPGFTWGDKRGFFANPNVGVNITAFHINRNWNARLLQTYLQIRAEYNTLLSSFFLGGGMILQFP